MPLLVLMPHAPELPGEECHSLRGAVLASSPAGLMSAYGDIRKPLECTSTRRRPIPPAVPAGFAGEVALEKAEGATRGAAESRATRPVVARPPTDGTDDGAGDGAGTAAGGMGRRRVLVHSSGFRMSPYADIKPAGEDAKTAPRKLWHSSPGSSGA